MVNRERMTYIFLVFILLWYTGVVLAVKFLGITVMEGVGLGTAGGVFLGGFQNMWQFLWRKASPREEQAGKSPSGGGTSG